MRLIRSSDPAAGARDEAFQLLTADFYVQAEGDRARPRSELSDYWAEYPAEAHLPAC